MFSGRVPQLTENTRCECKRSGMPRAGHVEFGVTHIEMKIEGICYYPLRAPRTREWAREQQAEGWALEVPLPTGGGVWEDPGISRHNSAIVEPAAKGKISSIDPVFTVNVIFYSSWIFVLIFILFKYSIKMLLILRIRIEDNNSNVLLKKRRPKAAEPHGPTPSTECPLPGFKS